MCRKRLQLQLFILQVRNSVPQLDLPFDYDPTWKECSGVMPEWEFDPENNFFLADPIYKLETNSMLNLFTLKNYLQFFFL